MRDMAYMLRSGHECLRILFDTSAMLRALQGLIDLIKGPLSPCMPPDLHTACVRYVGLNTDTLNASAAQIVMRHVEAPPTPHRPNTTLVQLVDSLPLSDLAEVYRYMTTIDTPSHVELLVEGLQKHLAGKGRGGCLSLDTVPTSWYLDRQGKKVPMLSSSQLKPQQLTADAAKTARSGSGTTGDGQGSDSTELTPEEVEFVRLSTMR